MDVEVVSCSHKENECPAGQLGGPDLGPQRCLCPICAAVLLVCDGVMPHQNVGATRSPSGAMRRASSNFTCKV